MKPGPYGGRSTPCVAKRSGCLVAISLLCAALAGCAAPGPSVSDVQIIGGQRADVPARDLAPGGLLRNGLTPQPHQFD